MDFVFALFNKWMTAGPYTFFCSSRVNVQLTSFSRTPCLLLNTAEIKVDGCIDIT